MSLVINAKEITKLIHPTYVTLHQRAIIFGYLSLIFCAVFEILHRKLYLDRFELLFKHFPQDFTNDLTNSKEPMLWSRGASI